MSRDLPPLDFFKKPGHDGPHLPVRNRRAMSELILDPFTGQMVPCVVCGMAPQVTDHDGCCSSECENDLDRGGHG